MENSFKDRFATYSKIGCGVVIALSTIVFIGWITNIEIFKSVLPGYAAMNPLEAIGFILASLALFFRLNRTEISTTRIVLINILSLFVFLLGSVVFLDFFAKLNINIDSILFSAKLGKSMIAPNSALNFILLGLALFTFNKSLFKTFVATQFFTLTAGVITMFAGIGYLYNTISFYQIPKYSAMPLNTACAFALLCFCILVSTQNFGMMKILTEDLGASRFARKLMLTAIILPVVLGCLRLVGLKYVDNQTGTAFLVVCQIIVFTIVIWITTSALYEKEAEGVEMSRKLGENNVNLEKLSTELSEKNQDLEKANNKIRELLDYQQKLQDITGED